MYGCSSGMELKVPFLPAERSDPESSAFFLYEKEMASKCQVTCHGPQAVSERSQEISGYGLLLNIPVAWFKPED